MRLVYAESARKDIEKLDVVVKKQLKKKLELFSKDPLKYSRKLINLKIGNYRWRVGRYRIVFDLKGRDINVLRVGHRREIYFASKRRNHARKGVEIHKV